MSSPDPAVLEVLDRVGLTRTDVADLLAEMRRIVTADVAEAAGTDIPTITFDQLGATPKSAVEAIKRRGCVIVKGTLRGRAGRGLEPPDR